MITKHKIKYAEVWLFLTWFSGAEWLRCDASIRHARLPGEAAPSAPDATDPWAGLHTTLLCRKGLAAGWAVNKHVVEQHPREASKHIHGPGKEDNNQVYMMQVRGKSKKLFSFFFFKREIYPLLTTAEWPKRLTSLCRSGLGRSLHSSQAEKNKKASGLSGEL